MARLTDTIQIDSYSVTVYEMTGDDVAEFFTGVDVDEVDAKEKIEEAVEKAVGKKSKKHKQKSNHPKQKVTPEQDLYMKAMPILPRLIAIKPNKGDHLRGDEMWDWIKSRTFTEWLDIFNAFKRVNNSFLSILGWLGLLDTAKTLVRSSLEVMSKNLEGLLPQLLHTALQDQMNSDTPT